MRFVSAVNEDSNCMCKVMRMLNKVPVCLVLDTGACVSLLSYTTVKCILRVNCGWTQLVLCYQAEHDGSHIECLGFVGFTARYNDNVIESFPFYVAEAGTSTLGIDLFRRLDFKLIDHSSQVIAPVLARNTKILEQFSTLLNASGELKYSEHKPMIDLNVKLIREPYRTEPSAMRDAVGSYKN